MKFFQGRIIKISISIFFIFLILFIMRGNFGKFLVCLKSVKIGYFFNAIFLFILIVTTLALRLKMIMEFQEIHLPLSNVVYLSLIGLFFNNFLPTSVAGDFVKAYYTAHYTNKTIESYISVIVDRVFGILAFILLAMMALLCADKNIKTPLVTNSILTLIFISFLLIFLVSNKYLSNFLYSLLKRINLSEIAKTLQIFQKTFIKYISNLKIILFAFYTSMASQIFSIILVASLAKGLSINISLWLLFLTLPIITVVSILPSLNGLGIRESAYVFLLGNHLGKEKALAISILWLGVMLSVSLLGGLVYLFRDFLLNKK